MRGAITGGTGGAPDRRHRIRWQLQEPDPSLSGLQGLQAMLAGTRPRPSAAALIGLDMRSAEPGRVRMAMVPAEYHANPLGSVHGGVITTVLDTVMACAVIATLPPGRACTTLELKVNFVRAVAITGGEVLAEGVAVHTGRQIGVAEGRLTDAAGRLFATASTSLLLFDLPPAPVPAPAPAAEGAGERVVEWDDPLAGAADAARMDGLAYLLAVRSGAQPRAPVAALLGMALDAAGPGRVTMSLPPGPHMNNPGGTMHGGMMATLLDSAMACAVHSMLPAGRGYTTLEIKVNYIRAVTAASGLVKAVGHVVHLGRQVAVAEASARDAADRLCATASTTCLVFDRPAP